MSDQMVCPYCRLNFLLPVELPCGHIMCFLCLKGLILIDHKQCPECNKSIPENYIHNVVLVDFDMVYETPDSNCWQYEGNRNDWWMYDARSNEVIEREFKKKTTAFQINIGPYNYVIDFTLSVQFRTDNAKLKREIRRESQRKDDIVGVAGVRFPNIFKQKDMSAYINRKDAKKIQPIMSTNQPLEDSETTFWLYQKNDKWFKFDKNLTRNLEHYYQLFLNNVESSLVIIKLKDEEYEVDFKNWIIKIKSRNEKLKIKRKIGEISPEVKDDTEDERNEQNLFKIDSSATRVESENYTKDVGTVKKASYLHKNKDTGLDDSDESQTDVRQYRPVSTKPDFDDLNVEETLDIPQKSYFMQNKNDDEEDEDFLIKKIDSMSTKYAKNNAKDDTKKIVWMHSEANGWLKYDSETNEKIIAAHEKYENSVANNSVKIKFGGHEYIIYFDEKVQRRCDDHSIKSKIKCVTDGDRSGDFFDNISISESMRANIYNTKSKKYERLNSDDEEN